MNTRRASRWPSSNPFPAAAGSFYVAQRDLNLALRDNAWLGDDSDAIEARTLIDQALGKSQEFVAKAFTSHIERSLELDLPQIIVYYHLSQFKHYPKFMDWLAEVRANRRGRRLRWARNFGRQREHLEGPISWSKPPTRGSPGKVRRGRAIRARSPCSQSVARPGSGHGSLSTPEWSFPRWTTLRPTWRISSKET